MDLKSFIRTIPDHPKPGIQFRDITTLMAEPKAFAQAIDSLADHWNSKDIDCVVGIEARGFVFGAALAARLGAGFIPLRKPGKLPCETLSQSYDLGIRQDTLHLHKGALSNGQRVLLIDDLIATGGTALAGVQLIERSGAEILACGFVIDLPDLGGANKLEEAGYEVVSLISFPGH